MVSELTTGPGSELTTGPGSELTTGPGSELTIGIAVPVPEPDGTRLQRARRAYGDPLADLIQTHITLLGPQVVTLGELPGIEDHLTAVARRHAPYRVTVVGTGSFRPVTQVVYLVVEAGAAECAALADDVRRGPLARELPYPYHPHVTLAHNVPTARLDAAQRDMGDERLEFVADVVTLYVCDADSHWRPVRSFALGAAEVRRV